MDAGKRFEIVAENLSNQLDSKSWRDLWHHRGTTPKSHANGHRSGRGVESGSVPTPGGLGVTLEDGTFTITWTEVAGAAQYEVHVLRERTLSGRASPPRRAQARRTFPMLNSSAVLRTSSGCGHTVMRRRTVPDGDRILKWCPPSQDRAARRD